MPTYDYVCGACGHAFELFQAFQDDPISECPNCGGPVRRVISATAIIFKGSGWYATDSKRPTAGLSAPKTGDTKASDAGADAATGGSSEASPTTAAADAEKTSPSEPKAKPDKSASSDA